MTGLPTSGLKAAAGLAAMLLAIPAGAMLIQEGGWTNGQPAIQTGDMLLEGCVRPGVESSCKVLGARTQPANDYLMRPAGPAVITDYGMTGANPVPAYDRPIVVIARPVEGRARICGGPAIRVTNWRYSADSPPCPARDPSPFD